MKTAIILLLAASVSTVSTFSHGAPDFSCRNQLPGHAGAPRRGQTPYRIIVDRTTIRPGETVRASLQTANDEAMPFKGFLCAASDTDVTTKHLPRGRMTRLPASPNSTPAMIKPVVCKKTDIDTGMTHHNDSFKTQVDFQWTAPIGAMNGQQFAIRCVTVVTFFESWNNIQATITIDASTKSNLNLDSSRLPTNPATGSSTGGSITSTSGTTRGSGGSTAPSTVGNNEPRDAGATVSGVGALGRPSNPAGENFASSGSRPAGASGNLPSVGQNSMPSGLATNTIDQLFGNNNNNPNPPTLPVNPIIVFTNNENANTVQSSNTPLDSALSTLANPNFNDGGLTGNNLPSPSDINPFLNPLGRGRPRGLLNNNNANRNSVFQNPGLNPRARQMNTNANNNQNVNSNVDPFFDPSLASNNNPLDQSLVRATESFVDTNMVPQTNFNLPRAFFWTPSAIRRFQQRNQRPQRFSQQNLDMFQEFMF